MVRPNLDTSLERLTDDLLGLGSMVEKALAKSLDALKRRDLEASSQVVQEDDEIDRQCVQLEEHSIELIARHQPVARDLRRLITTLHIAVELERMGDYAEGIAKISLMMGEEPPLKPLIDIPRMGEKASDMLRRSLDALVNRDTVAAMGVLSADDEVDGLYDQVYRELLTYMIQDPNSIQRATYLLWVAHDLERVADRATNIAERVIYLVTGRMPEVGSSNRILVD